MALMANLYVGVSGLQVAQNALNTTAHNMSNIGTEGYTRQQVSQGTRSYNTYSTDTKTIAWFQTGNGVAYNNCKQVRSVFLDASYREEKGRYEFYDLSTKTLEEIQDQLQEMDGAEFADALNNLWTSIQEMSKDPTSAVTQSEFITRSNQFVTRAKSIYEGLTNYQTQLDNTVETLVGDINSYGDQIRDLNQQIIAIESGGIEHANDLRDARNSLLDKLGEYGRIDYQEDIFGNVLVQFEGTDFVTSDHVNHMAIDRELESSVGYATPYWDFAAVAGVNAEGDRIIASIDGAKIYNLKQTISSASDTDIGKLRATLLARGDHNATYHDISEDTAYYNSNISQSTIMNVEAELDQLFHNVVTAINGVIENAASNPATLDKSKGSVSDYDMFIVSDPTACLEYDINKTKVAGTIPTGFTIKNTEINPTLLQEPTTLTFIDQEGNEDNAAVEALKKAFSSESYTLNPNMSSKCNIMEYYDNLVSQVATSGNVYDSIAKSQEITVSSVSEAREQIVGVSSDEELEFMIEFQNAYNASSRYINVVSEMLEHLVSTLGA